MPINVYGFDYTLVGNEQEGFIKDFMGHTFAIIEFGEVYKDGVHIGYLKWNRKLERHDFVSIKSEYNLQRLKDMKKAKKMKQPRSGIALLFYRNYGHTPEERPKWFLQYKRWEAAQHNITGKEKEDVDN